MLPKLLDPRPYFAHLPDPRRETRNKLHKPHDILMIVLCAVLSWVEDWVGMADFAEEKEDWLRGFLELPNGIPSHATSCPRWRSGIGLRPRGASTGASKSNRTGSWTCNLGKMPVGRAPTTRQKTWP